LEETGTEKAGKREIEKIVKEKKKRHHPGGELVDLIQTTSSKMQWEQKKEEGGTDGRKQDAKNEEKTRKWQKKNTRRPRFPSPARSSQKREEITQMLRKEKMKRISGDAFRDLLLSCSSQTTL
jgi:hypothetical protein